jgi:hypothetical protein
MRRRRKNSSGPVFIRDFTITRVSLADFPEDEAERAALCLKRFLSIYEESRQKVDLGLPENAPAAEIIHGFTKTLLSFLQQLVRQGDKGAATALARISREAVKTLSEVALNQPELVREYAQTCPNWPVLLASTRALCDNFAQIQKRIRLAEKLALTGEVTELFVKHRPKILRGLAIQILREIEFYRISSEVIIDPPPILWVPSAVVDAAPSLGAFGPKTWKEWDELAWRTVLYRSIGKPETSPPWKQFGIHKKDNTKLRKTNPNHSALRKRYASDQRAAIRGLLRRAIFSLSKAEQPLEPDWPPASML